MLKSGASPAASERNIHKLNQTSTNITGTTDGLKRQLKLIEAEIKEDLKGKKEYESYLTRLQLQKADLQKRIDSNTQWLAGFEEQSADGAFEEQYKHLLEEIQQIYEQAKEAHSKGIELLIRDFGYHIAYKRWNDTFTAIPFKPK